MTFIILPNYPVDSPFLINFLKNTSHFHKYHSFKRKLSGKKFNHCIGTTLDLIFPGFVQTGQAVFRKINFSLDSTFTLDFV